MKRFSLSLGLVAIALSGCAGDADAEKMSVDPNAVRATSPWIAAECIDGQFAEVPPNQEPIDDLIAAYAPENAIDFVRGVLARRYPNGAYIFDGGMAAATNGQETCFDQFLPADQRGAATDVIPHIDTLVHECGHMFDVSDSDFASSSYRILPDISFSCVGGDSDTRGGVTFARSLLNTDAFSALRPPCSSGAAESCDTYADVYLTGDPTDDVFESGDQGFSMLIEEAVQYVNSLATAYVVSDQVQYTVSARDGLLTFVWYVERYLQMARLSYPDAYAHLLNDPCWREMILTWWGRAWMFLEGTVGNAKLGIADAELLQLATAPELLAEIEPFQRTACP